MKCLCVYIILYTHAVTGDVQAASVVFYMRSVIVDCTLTEGSPATDCLAVFTRYSDSGTENVTSTTGICPQLTQTRYVYNSLPASFHWLCMFHMQRSV